MQTTPSFTAPIKTRITQVFPQNLPSKILDLGTPSFAKRYEFTQAHRNNGQPYPSRKPFQYVDEMSVHMWAYSFIDVQASTLAAQMMHPDFMINVEPVVVPTTAPISGLPVALAG